MPPPKAMPVLVPQAVPVPAVVAIPAPPAPPQPKPLDVAFPRAIAAPAPPAPASASAAAQPATPAGTDAALGPADLRMTPQFVMVPGPDKTKFPQPSYPYDARKIGATGTVRLEVHFDQRGKVTSVEVTGSSGSKILDAWSHDFVLKHWHLPAFAGQIVSVPIEYRMEEQR